MKTQIGPREQELRSLREDRATSRSGRVINKPKPKPPALIPYAGKPPGMEGMNHRKGGRKKGQDQ